MSTVEFGMTPFSSLYFGDGHPASAGEPALGGGLFPPTPRTLQGAVRRRLLSAAGVLAAGADPNEIMRLVGTSDALFPGWRVRGPWLASWRETEEDGRLELADVAPWVATPAFLVRSKTSPGVSWLAPCSTHRSDDLGDGRTPRTDLDAVAKGVYLLSNDGVSSQPFGGFVSPGTLLRIVGGAWNDSADPPQMWPPFIGQEQRSGVAIDVGRGRPEHGMLYSRNYMRFGPSSGFLGAFSWETAAPPIDPKSLLEGVVGMGSRNRLVRLDGVLSWDSHWTTVAAGGHLGDVAGDGRAWLFLTTPAAVSDPMAPEIVPKSFGRARLSVAAVAVAGARRFGGFDLLGRVGRATRRHLTAGTAWLLQIDGDEADRFELLKLLHGATTIGDEVDRAFGFGHTLVARVQPGDWEKTHD